MDNLSERQRRILKALVEEYINSAEPVGSLTLERKYELGVSPATIRNEMAELDVKGYLQQPHTSAGRIPTSKALRLYVSSLMMPKELSVTEEVSLKERVWDYRHELDTLMREATKALARSTSTLSLASDTDSLYYAGTGYVLDMPEFYDIDITRNLLLMLDEAERWEDLFGRMNVEAGISIILGPELRNELLSPYSFVFSKAKIGENKEAFIGVVGPKRLQYRKIIPTVRYCAELLEEIRGW